MTKVTNDGKIFIAVILITGIGGLSVTFGNIQLHQLLEHLFCSRKKDNQ